MLIMRNQGCIVAVTLGSDDPIWGPNPYCNCHICFKNTPFVPSEQKHLLSVLTIVMDLCREVRKQKDQLEKKESGRKCKSNKEFKLWSFLGS